MKNQREKVQLLDCTLRDGGYITDWKWGYKCAKDIINFLVESNVDVIEVGFLRNVDKYDENITVCNTIEELNRLLPENLQNTMFSAMAMRSNYDIEKLQEYDSSGIEMIRVTAHEYDIKEGMEFAQRIQEKGYKLSINPINIMGYTDERILWIVNEVNRIMPYQFSIVDTFGSMKRRDLDRIVSLVDNNLDKSIRLGLHLHENMAQSFSLAQNFIDKHIARPYTIDGSLMGMGRVPGNLPIELIADYMNEYCNKSYVIDSMLDVIQDYIAPIKGKTVWGYTPAYFLSARHNLHRNYAEYYLNKGDLTIRDINHILAGVEEEKAAVFDERYAELLYNRYLSCDVDDTEVRKALAEVFYNREMLILAPGMSLNKYKKDIDKLIQNKKPIVISLNFIPDTYDVDFAFFSNNKRYDKIGEQSCKIIYTSNLSGKGDFCLAYKKLTNAFKQGNNSLLMLLKLLSQLSVNCVMIAGADGFQSQKENYCDPTIITNKVRDNRFNQAVGQALHEFTVKIDFVTPSEYQKY